MDRRDQDCYFYYYSTCLKGDKCLFRHEPAALGCETICPDWQNRACTNVHCNLRHMLLRKYRKLTPCYWENKISGCRKPHCPFMHRFPKNRHLVAQPPLPGNVSHPGHPTNLPIHPTHPGHGNHPNHPGHSGHSNHQNHPIMEAEEKEVAGEPQVDPSQVAMERGEWANGGYEQPEGNVQVNPGEVPAQGNQHGGNQANGGQMPTSDPLVVLFDDGMRLY